MKNEDEAILKNCIGIFKKNIQKRSNSFKGHLTLKLDSHLPNKIVLFVSMKAL